VDFEKIDHIVRLLKNSHNTVVVTGAGISTEAGIPDFRGENGLYKTLGERRVMSILNIEAFRRDPKVFYEFYRQYFIFPPVEPGKAHLVLAEMERRGIINTIVTQNIDNLHQRAGSKRVISIHGNTDRYVCTSRHCQEVYDTGYIENFPEIVPTCSKCGSILKPDVVLFGEQIRNYTGARDSILRAKVLVVIGSSLVVYPLAGFVKEFSTFLQDLVIINKGHTEMDHAATVKLDSNNTGDILDEINKRL
jgi:NAD-dependent deacetylase